MQIFLLMILSAFMGGYYYLGSPALNVAHDFLPESVRTKGLIMCVVNEHKRALDDNAKNMRENAYQFEQTSPCAKSKNIVTKKFCMTGETISAGCYEKSSESETANYLSDHYFTTSVNLPKNINQNKILDFIKNMSGGLPNLGILFKTESGEFVILNPQTTTDTVSIKQVLVGANSLRKGQIVYFSHHTPAEVEAIVQNADFEALECKKETDIKVFNAEEQIWECRAFESLKKCFGDMLENENGDCIPNQDKKINCSSDLRAKFNYDASAWECQRRLSIACGERETLSWNGTINQYICVSDAEWDGGECEELVPNSDGSYSTVRIGGTASGYPCGTCEIHQAGKCTDECFPDPNSVPENLCAGSDCGYDAEREEPWKLDAECGDNGNCEKHKAIYWHNDTNRWKCVDCFPLEIKDYTNPNSVNHKYRKCLNGNIWVINSDGEKELDTSTACIQDGNYDALPANDYDGCYLTESDGLYCSFDGVGGFDDSGDGFGEKGFFCDIDHINDQEICEMNSSAWAWYDYISGNCYDPYDGDEVLQLLPDNTAPIIYSGLSFGCPAGYYRFREANGQISECKQKFCNVEDNSLPLPYEARITTNDECKTGYVEILNDTKGCFYCWIPPFEEEYTIEEKEDLNDTYLKAQAGSKLSTISGVNGGADTFEYRLATEIGTDCDADDSDYCKDTVPAHKSPPGWKRTWSGKTWSDAEPFWCADNHYPDTDGDGQANYEGDFPLSSEKCPAHYQTKLDGTDNEKTGILSACLYCLPEPFATSEVYITGTTTPPDSVDIIPPQDAGIWQIIDCNERIKTYAVAQDPPYLGLSYSYHGAQCALSSNTTGCPNGLGRSWNGSSWGDCTPIYCDEVDSENAPNDTEPDQRLGAYIPVQKDLGGDAGWCLYMWRPPYDTWDDKNSFSELENSNWDDALFITPPSSCSTDYCPDQGHPYDSEGFSYTWDDYTGWAFSITWCNNSTRNDLPTEIFPYTGKLEGEGDSACFRQAQPTLTIWQDAKPEEGCLAGGCNTDTFNLAIHSACATPSSDCNTTGEDIDFEFITDKPLKSTWDETADTGGWRPLAVDNCNSPASNTNNYFYYKERNSITGNYCADVWKPRYDKWDVKSCPNAPCPRYGLFNADNPTVFPFYECEGEECDEYTEELWPVQEDVQGDIDTSCYKKISYRKWTDLSGWPSNCTVNMCLNETEEDDNMLLKGVEDTRSVSIIEHCGENTKPAPHKVLASGCVRDTTYDKKLTALKKVCNGTIDSEPDCFYGDEDSITHSGYSYETETQAVCGSGGTVETGIWDVLTKWKEVEGESGVEKWHSGTDRLCESGDLPDDEDAPYTEFDYLWDYYPPSVSSGAGLTEVGTSVGSSTKNCKYYGINTVDGMTCPETMHTFYLDENDKVNCAFPSPPTSTCTADTPRWGVPLGKTEKTYWFGCDNGTVEHVVPATNTNSYNCSPGIHINCEKQYNNDDNKWYVNCDNNISIKFEADETDATNFLNLLTGDEENKIVVCGSEGNVKGWTIETYTPTP